MSEKTYQISRDSHNRLCAQVVEGITVGIKMHSPTSPRVLDRGEHGYAVVDVETPLGPLRIRDIKIFWSQRREDFFVRWPQWETGLIRRDGHRERLDVAGPWDQATRRDFSERILALFRQIKAEAELGTIGRSHREDLEKLKSKLESDGPAAEA
ncbi:MAG: hypothetical protein GF334_07980 [Candidatus Altiarchaeales archaeon]|nr:hypothetical protein [Candidatus Altiarchaeales archaeon]